MRFFYRKREINRWLLLAFVLVALHAPFISMGQSIDPMYYKAVSLQKKAYTLYDLSNEIARQTGFSISFNASQIAANKKIRTKKDHLTVETLLALIRKKANVQSKMVAQNIILVPNKNTGKYPSKQSVQKKKVLQRAETANYSAMQYAASEVSTTTNDMSLAAPGGGNDSGGHLQAGGGGTAGSGGGYRSAGSATTLVFTENEILTINGGDTATIISNSWQDPYNSLEIHPSATDKRKERINSFFKNNAYIAAGIRANETFYFDPSIDLGMRFLYATGGWFTGSAYSQVRYGLGTSMALSNAVTMHFCASTGGKFTANKNIPYSDTIGIDSFHHVTTVTGNQSIKIRSRLNQFSLAFDWRTKANISLRTGFDFNLLHTAYFLANGNPVAPATLKNGTITDPSVFETLKPLYTISNSFNSANTSDNKFWVGISVSIIYTIPFKR